MMWYCTSTVPVQVLWQVVVYWHWVLFNYTFSVDQARNRNLAAGRFLECNTGMQDRCASFFPYFGSRHGAYYYYQQ